MNRTNNDRQEIDLDAIWPLMREEDFRFSLKGWKSSGMEFFGPTPRHEEILEERRAWLQGNLNRYCGASTDSLPELRELAAEVASISSSLSPPDDLAPLALCRFLGERLEPDFMLLNGEESSAFRVSSGCVCFPSYWDFQSALGKELREIHSVVPGLNPALADKIDRFLAALKPGETWNRFNWGISLSPERNQHPSRRLARPIDADAIPRPASLWLRIELQMLHRLPATNALLFGIRPISIHFESLKAHPGVLKSIRRQWASMPEAMQEYKAIGDRWRWLDEWLAESANGH